MVSGERVKVELCQRGQHCYMPSSCVWPVLTRKQNSQSEALSQTLFVSKIAVNNCLVLFLFFFGQCGHNVCFTLPKAASFFFFL